jgi:alkyl hydroperoxide reductase subunit AhpF
MICKASILHDTQTDNPLAYCPECGGEIYHYDQVADVGGALVHLECIENDAQDMFRFAPAISFFGDGC